MNYETLTLRNNIQLVHLKTNTEVAYFGVYVGIGSRNENAEEAGYAHFLEHMMFKGTKTKSAKQIFNLVETIGGDINASTGKEDTFFSATFQKAYYSRIVSLFADIFCNSTFPEREIEKEKMVVLDEINSFKDQPSELIYDEFEAQVFGNHRLGHDILGEEEIVRNISRDKTIAFKNKNYSTNNMVICSIGNISFKRILSLVEKNFSDYQNHNLTSNCEESVIYKSLHNTKNLNTNQSHCIIGGLCYKQDHKYAPGFTLLNNILGGFNMNSRLNLAVREKHGLAYTIDSIYSSFLDTGVFMIYFGTDKTNVKQCKSLVYAELKKLKTKRIGTRQLATAKKQWCGRLAILNEIYVNQLSSLGRNMIQYGRVKTFEEIISEINNVSSSQILEIANEMFSEKNLSSLTYE